MFCELLTCYTYADITNLFRYGAQIGAIIVYSIVLIAIITFLIIDTADSRYRLISLLGVVVILALGWVFSKHPGQASSTLELNCYCTVFVEKPISHLSIISLTSLKRRPFSFAFVVPYLQENS